MGSLAKPRCARGQGCVHVLQLGSDGPPTVAAEGDLCERCHGELAGGYKFASSERWMDKVIEVIEAVYKEKPALQAYAQAHGRARLLA